MSSESKRIAILVCLVLINTASALAIVLSVYYSRQELVRLDAERAKAIHLEEEWGRLLLEQSTWAAPDRVEKIAKQQLGMYMPNANEIKVIK